MRQIKPVHTAEYQCSGKNQTNSRKRKQREFLLTPLQLSFRIPLTNQAAARSLLGSQEK